MRAITYTRLGDPSVLEYVDTPIPEPGDGEVRIRVLVSGVNPTDWKSRSGAFGGGLTEATVPNHDGAAAAGRAGREGCAGRRWRRRRGQRGDPARPLGGSERDRHRQRPGQGSARDG